MSKHPDDQNTDDNIIRLIQDENPNSENTIKGVQLLYKKYEPDISNFLSGKYPGLNGTALIKDAVQETLISAWNNIKSGNFRNEGKLRSYLLAIAKNTLNNKIKKNERYEYLIDQDDYQMEPSEQDEDPAVIEKARSVKIRIRRKCFEQLTEEEQEILEAKFLEKMTFKEIAATKKMNPGTLRQKVFGIRKKLKACEKKQSKRES